MTSNEIKKKLQSIDPKTKIADTDIKLKMTVGDLNKIQILTLAEISESELVKDLYIKRSGNGITIIVDFN